MPIVSVHASVDYNILIEKGSLSKSGFYAREVFPKAKQAAIITDDTVASLYLETVKESFVNAGYTVSIYIFPHGEDSKSQETLFGIYDFLIENQLTRSDFIVALGGGVVGDISGFAAATYLRGIAFMQIPTTFLAAVDSSVGGKTAINIPSGKNLIGAFHQPSLVVCDTETFKTLPSETFADGVAETVKTALISSKSFFEELENGNIQDKIDDIVAQCVSFKRDVVEEDEHDKGLRMILNYGHTLGHAIEKVTNHAVTHGHGVAMGMVLIARLGEKLGYHGKELTERIINCLEIYGLPTKYDGSVPELAQAVLLDKKRSGDTLNLIFVKEIGTAEIIPVRVMDFVKYLEEF